VAERGEDVIVKTRASANFFSKEPDSKYFRFGSFVISVTINPTLPLHKTVISKQETNEHHYLNKTLLAKSGNRPDLAHMPQ
jgi:hypothetical protein